MLAEYWESLPLFKRLYQEKLEPVCSEYSLTRMELNILLFLANNPVHDTATDIVEVRHLTKSHVSASVKTLQARGYLQRVFLAGNHKTVHLRLTPAAGPVVEQGAPRPAKLFCHAAKGPCPGQARRAESCFSQDAEKCPHGFAGRPRHGVGPMHGPAAPGCGCPGKG